MTPIKGAYHREFNDNKDYEEELTAEELKDPQLIDLLTYVLEKGYYGEATDIYTGRRIEKQEHFVLPTHMQALETDGNN